MPCRPDPACESRPWQNLIDGRPETICEFWLFDMLKHQSDGQQQRERIGDALAGNIRSRTVHGFEYRGIRADIGPGCHAKAAHQSGKLVGQDIAEQVGGDDDVELPRVHDNCIAVASTMRSSILTLPSYFFAISR